MMKLLRVFLSTLLEIFFCQFLSPNISPPPPSHPIKPSLDCSKYFEDVKKKLRCDVFFIHFFLLFLPPTVMSWNSLGASVHWSSQNKKKNEVVLIGGVVVVMTWFLFFFFRRRPALFCVDMWQMTIRFRKNKKKTPFCAEWKRSCLC
jgi:hypothetical protein